MERKLILYVIDAGVGDCILIHVLDKNIKILIDSGPPKGRGIINVPKALNEILKDDNRIDIAVVTHNDEDHIGGFATLIKRNIIEVKEFIFNDVSYISKLFPDGDGKYSYRQDKELKDILDSTGITIKSFCNKDDSKSLSRYEYKKIKFDFLSPNETMLKKYKSKVIDKEVTRDAKYSLEDDNKITSINAFNDLREKLIKNDIFIEDSKPANGTSLAFRLKIGSKNFLFLGDSHPSLVTKELSKLDSLEFDLCKLSHHGGEKNTSKKLLDKIKCSNFLICSDATNSHGHPSYKTIARILNYNSESKFYFSSNYTALKEKIDFIDISSLYPQSNYLKVEYEY